MKSDGTDVVPKCVYCGNRHTYSDEMCRDLIAAASPTNYDEARIRAEERAAVLREVAGVREAVLWFAKLMESRLRSNDHKGGWRGCDERFLWKSLRENLTQAANEKQPGWKVLALADVANFAMMIADNSTPYRVGRPAGVSARSWGKGDVMGKSRDVNTLREWLEESATGGMDPADAYSIADEAVGVLERVRAFVDRWEVIAKSVGLEDLAAGILGMVAGVRFILDGKGEQQAEPPILPAARAVEALPQEEPSVDGPSAAEADEILGKPHYSRHP